MRKEIRRSNPNIHFDLIAECRFSKWHETPQNGLVVSNLLLESTRSQPRTEDDSIPFRDHFRPPVSKRHSWAEVHGDWPMMIVQNLAPLLPDGDQATPRVHLGSYFEVNIGTLESADAPRHRPQLAGEGGLATMPEAELSLQTDGSDVSDYEVLILGISVFCRRPGYIRIFNSCYQQGHHARETWGDWMAG